MLSQEFQAFSRVSKILAFNDTEWRPDAWLSFLITGLAAGPNALVTMIPRVDPNSLVLTQNKAIRKHAREVSRVAQAAQAQANKSAGSSAIVDLTQDKVKNVNHYHIIKPQANMDKGTHRSASLMPLIRSYRAYVRLEI